MKIIVTGGAGFIGSHIVDALLQQGIEVVIIDNFASGKRENLPLGISVFEMDIKDENLLKKVFCDLHPEAVFHLAAQISVANSVKYPLVDAAENVIGGLSVLEAARQSGVKKIIFASSGGMIYGEVPGQKLATEADTLNPLNPYAASKVSFEYYLHVYKHLYNLSYTTLRYGNVYGPRQDPHGEAGVVAIFTKRLLEGKPVRVYAREKQGDEGGIRDYVYVADVVAANLMALHEGLEGVYNVATGHGRTTTEVLRAVADSLGVEPEIEWQGVRPGDLRRSVLDVSKLRGRGWQPRVEFKEGIEKTVAWFKDNY